MFILKDVTYKDILHIPYLQIQKEKIFIKDMLELAKQVAFLKKQQAISNSINNSEKATGVL